MNASCRSYGKRSQNGSFDRSVYAIVGAKYLAPQARASLVSLADRAYAYRPLQGQYTFPISSRQSRSEIREKVFDSCTEPSIWLLTAIFVSLIVPGRNFTPHQRCVSPRGFEPRFQASEACALSVELWGRLFGAGQACITSFGGKYSPPA